MGLSIGHLVLILIIVLVIYGPSRIGNVGRGIGEAVRGFKKGLNDDDSIDVTDSHRITEASRDPLTEPLPKTTPHANQKTDRGDRT